MAMNHKIVTAKEKAERKASVLAHNVPESISPACYDGPSQLVLEICTAYEQGYGHGYDQRGLPNPYRDKSLTQDAWDYGYSEGNRKRIDHELNKSSTS